MNGSTFLQVKCCSSDEVFGSISSPIYMYTEVELIYLTKVKLEREKHYKILERGASYAVRLRTFRKHRNLGYLGNVWPVTLFLLLLCVVRAKRLLPFVPQC